MQVACSLKGRHLNYAAFYEALFWASCAEKAIADCTATSSRKKKHNGGQNVNHSKANSKLNKILLIFF